MLACLSSGEAWKLFSRASVKGLLLCSGTFVHGGISEDRGLDSSPASPHGNQIGQKGQKGQKGPNPKGNKGQKGQKGAYTGPILEGGKGPAKGDSK